MKTARKLPASPLYKHEHMRLVRRQDQGFVYRTAKSYYQAGVLNHCPRSLSQRSTGAGEFDRDPQLDRNTKREKRVKQEVTITSRSLAPEVSDFFFYCVAERAVKPCRSSRSNTRGGMINPMTLAKQEANTKTQTTNTKTTNKQKTTGGKCQWMVRHVVKRK